MHDNKRDNKPTYMMHWIIEVSSMIYNVPILIASDDQ